MSKVTNTGKTDYFSRPLYINLDNGDIYVDVNFNDFNPSLHTITPSGEPDFPVFNFELV